MFRALVVAMISVFALSAAATDEPVRPTPVVKSLSPSPAKAGGELIAAGQNLGKDFVSSVFLTLGDSTFPLEMKSQTAEAIKVTVPADLKPGRYGMMVQMRGEVPRFIDEPVFVVIE